MMIDLNKIVHDRYYDDGALSSDEIDALLAGVDASDINRFYSNSKPRIKNNFKNRMTKKVGGKMHNLEDFRNKFIVFEGYDSTGKTSVAKLLVDYLNQNGVETIFTFQPGDDKHGPIAGLLRSLCKDRRWSLSVDANLFAFLFDRAECMDKVIRPAIKEGKTVVCDRHTYSSVAYQMFGKQLLQNLIESQGLIAAEHILQWVKEPYKDKPDIVYYFPERIGNRENNKNDLFDDEKSEFENRVKKAYETMSRDNWKVVLPGSSAEETLKKLLSES